ncbi:MAG TPA: hypothetical protein VIU44_05050 [Gaiellaceae bacterium]
MELSVHPDNGFAVVALVLGVASLVPVYGIAAAPFAVLFGVLGRERVGIALGVLGSVENAVIVLAFL